MSQTYAELVFLAGPQAGKRVILTDPLMLLGRSAEANVSLSEQYISREHARFRRVDDGLVIENISALGTWINGRKYKSGKSVLLDTGDLIGVGRETELLFVAVGDDVEQAVAAMLKPDKRRNAFGQTVKKVQPDAGKTLPALSEGRNAIKAVGVGLQDKLTVPKSSRRKKLLIILGVYMAAMVLLFLFLSGLSSRHENEMPIPPELSRSDIAKALETRPVRAVNPVLMEDRLHYALGLYQQYGLDSPHLYRVLEAFKEAYAYSGRNFFADPENDRMYQQVLEKVTQRVSEQYRNAYLLEKDQDWLRAEKEFSELLTMITGQDMNETNPLLTNVQDHYKRVKYFRDKKVIKKRTPWS